MAGMQTGMVLEKQLRALLPELQAAEEKETEPGMGFGNLKTYPK